MNFKKYHESKNLFDVSLTQGVWAGNAGDSPRISPSTRRICASSAINLDNTKTYTITPKQADMYVVVKILDSDGNIVSDSGWQSSVTFDNAYGIVASFRYINESEISPADFTGAMLNTGSQPLPYEPYSSEVWHDTSHYIHNTDTDTITTLPAVLYPNDTTATVGLKGNTVQSGTPTPDNPVMPQGTGERTGNLFDMSTMQVNAYLQSTDGTYRSSSGNSYSCLVKVKPNTSYRVRAISKTFRQASFTHEPQVGSVPTAFYSNDHDDYRAWAITFTSGSEDRYVMFFCYSSAKEYVDGKTVDEIMSTVMISEGTDISVPFEPYGYKIPISSANTTTNIYLGEEQTTRRVKKLVFTGQENNWTYSAEYTRFTTIIPNAYNTGVRTDETPCTHYVSIHDGRAIENVPDNSVYTAPSAGNVYLSIKDTAYTSLDAWKSYLQQQYANGTPVTVWYVLATPTAGIVNEPLMKIGNYADTVSNISIPVAAGANTLSVGTTVQPSDVTVNYKGWHPVTDVHERNNGAWT